MALFTAANAAEMGRRSAELRKQREQAAQDKPLDIPSLSLATVEPTEPLHELDLARVRQRLDTLDALMAKAETDRQWDNLSRAYERMFKVWMVLSKTPLPGSLKPISPRQPKATQVEPLD